MLYKLCSKNLILCVSVQNSHFTLHIFQSCTHNKIGQKMDPVTHTAHATEDNDTHISDIVQHFRQNIIDKTYFEQVFDARPFYHIIQSEDESDCGRAMYALEEITYIVPPLQCDSDISAGNFPVNIADVYWFESRKSENEICFEDYEHWELICRLKVYGVDVYAFYVAW